MLRAYIGSRVTVTREDDGASFGCEITSWTSPRLRVRLTEKTSLKKGQRVTCGVSNGVSFAKVGATVLDVGDEEAEVWVTVQSITPGQDRAVRAMATGTSATVEWQGQIISGSLCDCSESGLRISSLEYVPVGETVEVVIGDGPIRLTCKTVRHMRDVNSDYTEIGMQIEGADRLSRARWNHLVFSLLNRYGQAG